MKKSHIALWSLLGLVSGCLILLGIIWSHYYSKSLDSDLDRESRERYLGYARRDVTALMSSAFPYLETARKRGVVIRNPEEMQNGPELGLPKISIRNFEHIQYNGFSYNGSDFSWVWTERDGQPLLVVTVSGTRTGSQTIQIEINEDGEVVSLPKTP